MIIKIKIEMKILKNRRRVINTILVLSVLIQILFTMKMFTDISRLKSSLSYWKQNAETYVQKHNTEMELSEFKERAETFSLNSVMTVEHASDGLSNILRGYLFSTGINAILILLVIILIRRL